MLTKGKVIGGIAAGAVALGVGSALVKIKNTIETENYKIELVEKNLPPPPEILTSPESPISVAIPVFLNKTGITDVLNQAGIETLPKNGKVYVCSGHGCFYKTPYRFSTKLIEEVKAIWAANATGDAEIERSNIRQSIDLIKKTVGVATGTDKDNPGESFFGNGVREQMSDYDETVNTLQYMYMLTELNLIKYHHLNAPEKSPWNLGLVNSITDAKTKKTYAIGYDNKGFSVVVER